MNKRYFLNNGLGCFGCSLANLLLELDDEVMAYKILKDYNKHPLVLKKEGGVFHELTTRAVKELTKGCYEGRLSINLRSDLPKILGEIYGQERRERLIQLIKEEEEGGRITRYEDNEIMVYGPPALFLVSRLSSLPRGHFVVTLGDGLYIDNGVLKKRLYDGAKFLSFGLLELKKVKSMSLDELFS